MKKSLPLTFIQEMSSVREELDRERDNNNYAKIYGLAGYNAKRGDIVDFHEGSTIGRFAFAQESGIFCNLDQT